MHFIGFFIILYRKKETHVSLYRSNVVGLKINFLLENNKNA